MLKPHISRRDFLNGFAISLAAGITLSPMDLWAQAQAKTVPALGPDYYPPKLTGLRGSHVGSFEVDGHKLIGYGGSQSIDSPASYSPQAMQRCDRQRQQRI